MAVMKTIWPEQYKCHRATISGTAVLFFFSLILRATSGAGE